MRQSFSSVLLRSACALALSLPVLALPDRASAEISVSITLAPPELPVYEQPMLVSDGAIWAPGYWAYGDRGYYWVPGTWVQPPDIGLMWTPGYWGWGNGGYAWNQGYWGAEVGFYGGVNYGHGYNGHGYEGGHWQDRHFYYNTAVSQVNVTEIHNVYHTTISNSSTNRVSYNGGAGGISARPNGSEEAAARAPHRAPTADQAQHHLAASSNHSLLATENRGKPPIAATVKPGDFNGRAQAGSHASIAPARTVAGPATAPSAFDHTPARAEAPVHMRDVPAPTHEPPPTSGDVSRDKQHLQQQSDLHATQDRQRQVLQQQQTQDHARAAQQPAASNRPQELERQHQVQTQAMVERHTAERQTLHETQGKPEPRPQ